MNAQLDRLASKLKSYRFSPADDRRRMVNELYGMIFGQGDFYQEIWDEPILLGIQSLVTEYPPKLYSSESELIKKRTCQTVAINDFFAGFLRHTDEELPGLLDHVADKLDFDKKELGLSLHSTLSDIRRSNLEFGQKIKEAAGLISQLVPSMADALNGCFEAATCHQERGLAMALLVTRNEGVGGVSPVRVRLRAGEGQVIEGASTEDTFRSAVVRGREALYDQGFLGATQDVVFTPENTDANYSGSSVALAAAMAMYSSAKGWQFDPYTAFTGDLGTRDGEWRVLSVDGIPAKLAAAQQSGIRRVVLPRQNESDVPRNFGGLELIFVDEFKEILEKLVLPKNDAPIDTVQQRKSVLIQEFCSARGYQVSDRTIQKGLQFTITPPTSKKLVVTVYDTGTHTLPDKPTPEFTELLDQLTQCDSTHTPIQSVNEKFYIEDPKLRADIQDGFESLQPQKNIEQYCDYSFRIENPNEKLVVKQYSKGTLQLQGHAGPLYRQALEIIIPRYNVNYPNAALKVSDYLESAPTPVESTTSSKSTEIAVAMPYIGTDESGKGDYFGPLVIAGVWVDEQLQDRLEQLGVRDSKKLSDRQCRELAARIRELCASQYYVVEISPEKYNQLHEQFTREKKNLNHLLAWGHARTIESLLGHQTCSQAIADQFGDEKYISSKLMEKGKTLKLLQTPKAERFIAVAAASVLARDHFLSRLNQLSNEAGLTLPKGASQAVIEAAKEVVNTQGADALRKFAKLHFKTTATVLAEGKL